MKYLTALFLVFFLAVACQQEAEIDPNAIPEDLAGKKEFLKNKKAELRQLNQLIDQTEKEIDALIPDDQKARTLVTTMPVPRQDFERFVEIQATVKSDGFVAASSEIGGRIVKMNFKEGDYIRKGQLVAVMDLEQVDKQIAELETALSLATEVFERQSRLWKQNIGSEIQYLEAKNGKERLEKNLETVRFQKTKAKVYAPTSGIVTIIGAEQGEVASPGMPILQILNVEKVKVIADIPETFLGKIKKGQYVDIRFPALDKTIRERISRLGSTIDAANRTFEVVVNLNNKQKLYKPNLLALFLVKDFEATDVPVVPVAMVQQDVSGKDFVFIKKETDKGPVAQKVMVKTGENYNGNIIIQSGLQGGEELIVDGAKGLTDGQLIKAAKNVVAGT
ncbi:MAG: efflux RND transporter periplasmic adaptor subunit [Bacteroidota bacterium]